MMFTMILFWELIIVAVVLGVRWFVGQEKESRSNSSLEILRQRYARGEINKDEFEAKRRELLKCLRLNGDAFEGRYLDIKLRGTNR